jgi:ABC-type branched-subunit amino acid transport system substrate-binding protein
MSGDIERARRARGVPLARSARLVAACLAAGLAVAACATCSGGSGQGSVAYGVLSCFTGNLASLGEAMLQGSQVAQKAIDDGGGILGKQLRLSHADTQCDEADSVPATRKLLATDGVVGIIGPETQEIAAVSPIITQAKIPTEFQGGSTLFDRNANRYLWRDSPSDSQLGVAMALYAYNKGYRNAALLFYSDIAAQTFIQPITDSFHKLGGQIVSNITVAPDQTSYRSQVQQVINAHPDVIFTQTDPATAAVLFQNFKELDNLAIPFVGTDVTGGGEYLKAVTFPVAHDHLISVYGTDFTGQGATTFANVYKQVFGSKNPPLANANYAYDAVISLALAMDKANTTSGPGTIQAMKDVTNPPGTACYAYKDCLNMLHSGQKINYEGASGDLDYNQYQNVFGPYGAFQVDATGNENQVTLLTAQALAQATP